jgi:SpoVK/Ycf46/Vps4 family AAA+-type ATPase
VEGTQWILQARKEYDMNSVPNLPTTPVLPGKLETLFHSELLPNARYRQWWETTYVEAKVLIFNSIAMQPLFRELHSRIGGKRALDVLLGVPGTGKTCIAYAMCNLYAELGKRRDGKQTLLLHARTAEWFSSMLGGSAKIVAEAFQGLRIVARSWRIAMILDEIDSIATNRESLSQGDPTDVHRFVNTLLSELDGLPDDVELLFVATSNQRHMIDAAFLDRASHVINVSYCGRDATRAILRDLAREYRHCGLTVSDTLADEVVQGLYDDPDSRPQLSRRDLADLFRLTMEEFSTLEIRPQHVLRVARDLSRRKSNGST